jgi:hypothetical protein
MNYTKPEITLVASAGFVIQGTEKGIYSPTDAHTDRISVGAYEADE